MTNAVALFVFIPFCKIKCTYCDFNVYAHLARQMEPYADAVVKEIQNSREAFRIQNSGVARTIYFGGGTPSLMPIMAIEKILRACQDTFTILPGAEITLEVNPGNVDAERLRALRSLGVNRLSLGVQSFDDATLRRLNRGHTVADALETFEYARRAGFDNISLDFIYGLPLQTLADWRATLERAVALQPEHLSLYGLAVEAGTGLDHQIKRGKYPMPQDDLAAEMYELAEALLDAAGYAQYEISNWARRARARRSTTRDSGLSAVTNGNVQQFQAADLPNASPLQSKHNLTYWRNEPYLGFGAGAHSCFSGERYWNVLSPLEYIERVERNESAVDGRESIDRVLEIAETMFLGLRLNEGITFSAFANRYGEDTRTRYGKELMELQGLRLIELSNERVCLTPRGRLLSNQVFWRFLP